MSLQSLNSDLTIIEEVPKNAAAQKKTLIVKKDIATKLLGLQAMYKTAKDSELKNDLIQRIIATKKVITDETKRIAILKQNAAYQVKSMAKKLKMLYEYQEVVKYDSPGCPLILHTYPDFYDHIYDYIKFEKAHKK